jgi:hypothetical protein
MRRLLGRMYGRAWDYDRSRKGEFLCENSEFRATGHEGASVKSWMDHGIIHGSHAAEDLVAQVRIFLLLVMQDGTLTKILSIQHDLED